MPSPTRPAEAARVEAGLSLRQAAKAARVTERYLRSVELGSRPCSYSLAETLAHVYAFHGNPCGINPFFLPDSCATGKNASASAHTVSAHKEVAGKGALVRRSQASEAKDASGERSAGRVRRSADRPATPAVAPIRTSEPGFGRSAFQ